MVKVKQSLCLKAFLRKIQLLSQGGQDGIILITHNAREQLVGLHSSIYIYS